MDFARERDFLLLWEPVFAYVASMQAIASDVGIAAIFGAQIIGGIIAAIIGFFIDKIRKYFHRW